MVSVMTTHPSSMVAHAGGKLCEHLTGTQARYPSIDLVLRYEVKTRPSPRTDFRTMSGVLMSAGRQGLRFVWGLRANRRSVARPLLRPP
jgi:hypothetical protein